MVRVIAALALATLTAAPLRAADTIVNPAQFAAALADAKPGATLRLSPGIYRGQITIATAALKLVGSDGVVIDGGRAGNAVTIAADNVELHNLTIRNSGRDLAKDDAVVLLREAHQSTVEACRIEARAFGIYVRAGGGNRIVSNQIRGDLTLTRSQRGNGIHLWHTEANEVVGNRVIDVRDGLYLSFADRNLISDNRATGVRYGIHYMYSNGNRLIGNHMRQCVGGIALMFARNNTIEANQSTGNRMFGILALSLEDSRIVRNIAARNGRGLFIEDSSRNRLAGNRIVQNGVGAFVTAGAEENLFTDNDFDGNLVQAFVDHAGINQWSDHGRGNMWSDYVGFDFNGDGIGEIPYRLQTASSALMAREPAARWFMMSPVLALLDWWNARVVETGETSLDPAPLVAPIEGRNAP
jgi:nitrous oxidase accessory protein